MRSGQTTQRSSPTYPDIPTNLSTANVDNPSVQDRPPDRPPDDRTTGHFYSATSNSNYDIPLLSKEIEEYKNFDHDHSTWRNMRGFYSSPLYLLGEQGNEQEAQLYKANVMKANMLWRRGRKPPRIFPGQTDWEKLPETLREALEEGMNLDFMQGLNDQGELEHRYFPNEERHKTFLRELNEYSKRNKYTATAPRPQWNLSSHLLREGMDLPTAMKAAALYRAEAELLCVDLLCAEDKKTNEQILRDPEILHTVKSRIWNAKEDSTTGSQAQGEEANTA